MPHNRLRSMRAAIAALALVALLTFALLPALAQQRRSRDEWQQKDRVLHDLNLQPGMTVADVGCGSGYFTLPMAEAVGDEGKILAVDINAEVLGELDKILADGGIKNVEARVSEGADCKVDAGSADAAIICNVIHHVPEEQRAPLMQTITDGLKPGGSLFVLDWREGVELPSRRDDAIPHGDLVKLVEDTGLELDAEFHYLEVQVFLRFKKPAE